ncbi:hypothetical protein PSTT_02197 [Puccinia striiformis]|uniref:Uncharacterized protein n=1 Tax=Puccinia striiformis TaxID=27350 RepID=A0A2S4W0P3_9BASI|nr:hypothetical protein PSTT_02197 [Puccinia striiformis]
MFSCTDYDLCDSDFNRSSTLLFHSASNAAPLPLLPEWTDHYPQGLIQRPTTPLYEPYQYGNQPSVTPGIFDQNFSISGDPAFLHSADTSSSRSSSIFGYGTSAESFSHAPEYSTIHSFDSGRSFCNTVSSISIPSPPRLFADTPISRTNHFINPAHLEFTGLLPQSQTRSYKRTPSESNFRTINPKASRNPREIPHKAKLKDPNANMGHDPKCSIVSAATCAARISIDPALYFFIPPCIPEKDPISATSAAGLFPICPTCGDIKDSSTPQNPKCSYPKFRDQPVY